MRRTVARRRSRNSRPYSEAMMLGGWASIGLAVILVAASLWTYVQYRTVWNGINHVTLSDLGKRPPKYNNALNILVIGSDSRSGKNRSIGGFAQGQRSDTVMILHLSPGRKGVTVLSFPRDTAVPILQCPSEPGGFGGQQASSGVEQLNSTFAYGGPNCLLKTLEQETQVRIDNFVQLNFTGFISVINALGGVKVCLPVAITPTYYDHLSLPAGPHVLKGYKALEYWRLREGFGLGSDLQRIQRDQLLMVSLVQKILSMGVLHSPTKLYSIVRDIVNAHALTTDTGLTPERILQLASSTSGVSRTAIHMVEVPTVSYPANPNWVEWDPTQAPALFSVIAHDIRLPKIIKHKKSEKAAPAPKLLAPGRVHVKVLNGSGVTGIAGTTATALTGRGFRVLGAVSANSFNYTQSVVEYGSPAELPAARTVAAQLSNVTLRQVSSVPTGTVDLILGSTFKSLSTPSVSAQPKQPNMNQFGGYSGATNICRGYGSAFMN